MIFVFYGFLVLALFLLYADVRGLLVVACERARWWRRIGLAAAAGPGLGPLLGWLTGRLEASWPYPFLADAIAFLLFAAGVLRLSSEGTSTRLRRVGYAALIVLAAAPSFVLLVLTPFVAVAGLALAKPQVVNKVEVRPLPP